MLSVIAILISFCSFYFARKSWQESNRPIVVAYIEEEEQGELAILFNLVVANTGTRPAKNVRLNASRHRIENLFVDNIEESVKEMIYRCFRDNARIALLKNGESLISSFSQYSKDVPGLELFAELPVTICYLDLNDKKFQTNLNLFVKSRKGFGGGVWKSGS